MSTIVRAASEAAAWAFAGVFMALALFFVWISMPVADAAARVTALALLGAGTAFVAVVACVRGGSPSNGTVVGTRRGAAIGVLVVVVVSMVNALFYPGPKGVLYSIQGQLFWALLVAGVPFAVAGALVGRRIQKKLLGSSRLAKLKS